MAQRSRGRSRLQAVRDVTLFVVGLAGLIDQAFFARPIQPVPMAIFAAMVGYPGALAGWTINLNLPSGSGRPDHGA